MKMIQLKNFTVVKKEVLAYIKIYYAEIQEIVSCRFDVYKGDLYYRMLCSDPTMLEDEIKAFYFKNEVLLPLIAVLKCVIEKGSVLVDGTPLTNEFRLSVGSMMDILKSVSPKCRKMMLEKMNCPSGAYSDLEYGFMSMDAVALQRAADKVDFTNDFKRISFLRNLAFCDIQDKTMSAASLDEKFYDILLIANGRPFDENFQQVLSACINDDDYSFEIVFSTAKQLIKDCYWTNIDCFTRRERTLINKVLASRLFASFVSECRKEFKKDHPKDVFSEERIVDNYSKKKTDEVPVNVIRGVRGLAKFVGVGVTKAQEIVNSKILEENGISYWVGRKICFDGEKLAAFLTSNPDALKGKKLSKKR